MSFGAYIITIAPGIIITLMGCSLHYILTEVTKKGLAERKQVCIWIMALLPPVILVVFGILLLTTSRYFEAKDYNTTLMLTAAIVTLCSYACFIIHRLHKYFSKEMKDYK